LGVIAAALDLFDAVLDVKGSGGHVGEASFSV